MEWRKGWRSILLMMLPLLALPASSLRAEPRSDEQLAAIGGPFLPAEARRLANLPLSLPPGSSLDHIPVGSPLASYRLVSSFGPRRDPINRRVAIHQGIDLKAPAGMAVRVTAPGVVTKARRVGSYGKLVEIDHGNGVRTRYAHLKSIAVKPGQKVAAGRMIGRVGSTGRSTGPHLHYEVVVNGLPRDPVGFLRLERRGPVLVDTGPIPIEIAQVPRLRSPSSDKAKSVAPKRRR